ncbi:MAG TPA: penicillin-binding protein 2 [Candidatus Acidoferrales bacterium]|nr:penicillin-binding protein 2 [Candidatus Acidoferrales bacterium]
MANWIGNDQRLPQGRLILVSYLIVLSIVLLLLGFWKLQIIQSGHFADLAEKNRIRSIPIIAPRGKILDRNGRVIVDNYPSFSVLLLRDDPSRLRKDLNQITEALDITRTDLEQQLEAAKDEPKFQPIVVKPEATDADIAYVDSHREDLPELELMMVQRRKYPPNDFLAHVIGYVGEVSPEQLEQQAGDRYKPGDIVGKAGLEREYNDILTGTDGMRRVIVNSVGKSVRTLDDTEPIPGKPIQLTIDYNLQAVAEQEMAGKVGALIAYDPRSGEVLAMTSQPSFDPNDFAVRIRNDEWRALNDNPGKPLLDRAIQAQVAPGSVFKILMATAMLETHTPPADFHVFCPGYAVFYGRVKHDWDLKGHGEVGLHNAIVHSCDVFFYNVGQRMGIDKIAHYASLLGLGKRTGIDLPSEEPGLVPSPEWAEKVLHRKWYAGETINVAIGQGATEVTPIQLVRTISGIASDGVMYQPHLLKDFSPVKVVHVPLSQNTIQQVVAGMYGVVNEGGGTGQFALAELKRANLQNIEFCGKTGTAQVISAEGLRHLAAGERKHFGYNTWFIGFAPKDSPEIAVAVLVQDTALEAGGVAAPIAGRFVEAYFQQKLGQPIRELQAAQEPPKPRKPKAPAGTPVAAVVPQTQ